MVNSLATQLGHDTGGQAAGHDRRTFQFPDSLVVGVVLDMAFVPM